MTLGSLFYCLAAFLLLVVGLEVMEADFNVWMVAAGLALLGVVFSSISLPLNSIMVVRKGE